jgi:hypothetical protein
VPKTAKAALTRKRAYRKDVVLGLCEYLNAAKATPGKDRVLALLQAMQQFRVERRPRRRHQLLLKIFDRFAWYRFRLRLGMTIDPRSENWTVDWKIRHSVGEGDALNALLKLHDENLEQKLRRCRWQQCGNWFFSGLTKQKFCKRKCQMAAYRLTDGWSDRNAEHQKAFRERNK